MCEQFVFSLVCTMRMHAPDALGCYRRCHGTVGCPNKTRICVRCIARKRQLASPQTNATRRRHHARSDPQRNLMPAAYRHNVVRLQPCDRTEQRRKRLLEEGDSALTELLEPIPASRLRKTAPITAATAKPNKPGTKHRRHSARLYRIVLHGLIITQNSDN